MAEVRSALDKAAIVVRLQKTKPKKTKTNMTDSTGNIKTVYNINSTLIPPHIPKEPDLKRINADRNSTFRSLSCTKIVFSQNQ
jgi:hypothetical protein